MTVIKNKISVIVPCYNQESYIIECLQSVRDQVYQDWECIIVNDGSTDGTEEICIKFVQDDDRFKYLFQKNQGVSAARNKGFQNATGEYIQFLDGDDYIANEKLATQIEFMQDNPTCEVCYTSHKHFFQKKKIAIRYQFAILDGQVLSKMLYDYDNGVSIPIHTALLRRNIWGELEMPFAVDFNGRYEDWVFWVSIALKGVCFRFLDYDFAYYRIHDTNFCLDESQLTTHSLKAMHYIAEKLPVEEQEKFISTRKLHFENRYKLSKGNFSLRKTSPFDLTKRIFLRLKNKLQSLKKELVKQKEKNYRIRLRDQTLNADFSIISNNCWGGGVYETLDLPYRTPTVGLYFFSPCYIKLVSNLNTILAQPISFVTKSKYEKANKLRYHVPYPIGVLNDEIEIHFLHYYTKLEALEKWNRRTQRVNFKNILLSFTDNEPCTLEEIRSFDKLPYRKVFFSSKNIKGINSLVWLRKYNEIGKIGDIYTNPWDYRSEFDLASWLNGKQMKHRKDSKKLL